MKRHFEILRKCPLFKDISDGELDALLSCLGAQIVSYRKRETVISEGEPAKYVGIVLSGSVQISRLDYYGNRSIVGNVEASELFGESFACAEVKSIPVDVTATEDTQLMLIDCLRITHSCIKACAFHQRMVYNLMRVIAAKNLAFHQKIEITSKRTTREKLMAYLLLQAKRVGKNSFDIPYDRQELADYLEVDRSGLSAEISKLLKEGVLKSNRSHFELL